MLIVNLPLVFICKFREKEINLQPPGEPREHRLDEVIQGRSKSKFNISFLFQSSFDIFSVVFLNSRITHLENII